MKKFVWGLSALMAFAWIGCSDDGTDPDPGTGTGTGTTTDYEIPDYADDYSSISSWSDRTSWNLANVHDPTVAFDGEYYYMYQTDASYGNAHEDGGSHFYFRRSKDLVNWSFRTASMFEAPAWVKDTLNSMRADVGLDPIDNPTYGYWAPVVRKVGEKYRMYYSIIVDNYIKSGLFNNEANFDGSWTEHAFIGMMEASSLSANNWEDKGMVVHSVSDRGTDWSRGAYGSDWNTAYFYFNAIDPTLQVTPDGKQYLIYGSWHSGFACVELDPETGKPYEYNGVADKSQRIASRVAEGYYWSRWQGSEGPEIMYNEDNGYYYLFMAYGTLTVNYNTRVCRSKNIEGPYLDYFGNDVADGYADPDGNGIPAGCYPIVSHPYQFDNHTGWVGFSHNCVFQDNESGDWFYASQARLPENVNGNIYSNALMMGHVRKIRWTSDDWPVIMPERYTAAPQESITEDELVGSWEHITLNYEPGVMQTSTTLTLNSDHIASGAITGVWSFDSDENVLTIGGTELCIEREADWEASPRVLTIVYSGITSEGVTYWGKKVD